MRPERLAGDAECCLHPLDALDARVMLVDELEVDRGGPRHEAFEGRELVFGRAADVLGDLHATAREAQIHPLGTPVRSGWALVRLTWSLSPHPPAGASARSPGRPRRSNSCP